jgi:hypothetical protein
MSAPSWARVGAKVVCIHKVAPVHGETIPTIGAVYTVRDVVDYGDEVGLRLVEIINSVASYSDGRTEAAFIVYCFKPTVTITVEDDLKAHFSHLLDAPLRVSEEA